ncbi:bifunctional 5,10-methylene-tetrahydrofolate dehydrogenase/5,10-methylene-tetrahydrofolate cyclohydrolase [Verrucomicrobia bacterium]|jgi:methylenetetrahydrofolate dehydrogenase (NADP+)/methenyltetrahydrofolate cyclohydrolase|nr:bifunctional 5,10-methylene-tetrahydrofolate dehydrogenase/5,10-methylene-tetrahydrofolate cyclohydrolase [Verrucomicrobiota bacterium]MDG1890376.1 tetrahydrofolate dehydrogenase/cyclohydrolase catalytic domain-containing protein [Verrucomicrobiota bacterium]
MDNLIDGRRIAATIHSETVARVGQLKDSGVTPGLVFIRVGEDPASRVYVGMKERKCHDLGIHSSTLVLENDTSQSHLLGVLEEYNQDPRVHGILVQAPLPRHMDETVVYATVNPSKDVDGFHPVNVGKLMLHQPGGFLPCTPAGVHELLIRTDCPLEGAEVVVLGRGNIVGKPMASMLMQKSKNANATVTLCHSRSRNIAEHCRRADVIIAALGVPEFVTEDMIKPGAVVIDVGVNRISDPGSKTGSRLVGDIDFHAVQPKAGAITPNPGGVGPMTIAMLMRNTVIAAEQQTLDITGPDA